MRRVFLPMVMGMLLSAGVPLESSEKKVLEWQDNREVTEVQQTWQEAIDYCEHLTLNSYDDWRVPNINELKSIIKRGTQVPALIDKFNHVGKKDNFGYWSSTSLKGEEHKGWYVLFDYGYSYNTSKSSRKYVRCVRNQK